jgi:hypothetical protein
MIEVQIGNSKYWCIGFESHDAKGYVFKDPINKAWVFFRREVEYPIYARPLTKLYSNGTPRRMSMNETLEIGMMCERELVRILRPLVKPLHVYSLPMSGAHTQGTDVIITKNEELDLDGGRDLVRRSLVAISCVRRRKLMIDYRTPIKEWYQRCKDDKVMAVVNWVEDRYSDHETYWFLIVTDENVRPFGKYGISVRKVESMKSSLIEFTSLSFTR